ncbi:MAG: hypothetical protein LKG11_05185 [Bacilli bacterium]|jgi:hypothetical protein|nr:hypothetical protein [Bacilli bacterium]
MRQSTKAKIKDSWQSVKKHFHDFLSSIKLFFLSLFSSFKSTFRTIWSYFLIGLQFASLILASFAFAGNSSNAMWAYAMKIPVMISDGNYVSLLSTTGEIDRHNSALNSQYRALGLSLNEGLQYNTFSFYVPVIDGKQAEFSISVNSVLVGGSSTYPIGDFFQYYSETVGAEYFSACQLARFDTSSVGSNFLSYSFYGKDASSIIPMSLADQMLLSLGLQKGDYESLLGIHYSISEGGNTYNFSVNNIYYEDIAFGANISKSLGCPVITNCSSLFSQYNSVLCTGLVVDGICLEREMEAYSKALDSDTGISFCLVNDYGSKTPLSFSDDMENAILTKGNNDSVLTSGTNIVLFALSSLSVLGQLVTFYFLLFKNGINSVKPCVVVSLFDFLQLCIYELLLFGVFKRSIVYYYYSNIFFAAIGVIVPLIIFVSSMVFFGAKNQRRNYEKNC